MSRNYHVILGITSDATLAEIKSAYRRRALELHPDHSGEESDRFLELRAAYAALANEAIQMARRQSHSLPSPGVSRGEPMRQAKEGVRDLSLANDFETFAPSFDDVFARLWSNFNARSRPKAERAESLSVDVPVSREMAMQGGVVEVLVPALVTCPSCRGSGEVGLFDCWRCNGRGRLVVDLPVAVEFPAGLAREHIVQVALTSFGIQNLYLTVRFVVSSLDEALAGDA